MKNQLKYHQDNFPNEQEINSPNNIIEITSNIKNNTYFSKGYLHIIFDLKSYDWHRKC